VPVYQRDWQTHHVEVTALNAIDEFRGESLNRVAAGFVHRLTARDILLDFQVCQFDEMNSSYGGVHDSSRFGAQADSGDDLMMSSRKKAQHARRVRIVQRLFEYVLIGHDHSVGGEDHFARVSRDRESLLFG